MINRLDSVYDEYLVHIVFRMEKDFRNLDYVHLDESTHQIVKNKKVRSTSYELIGVSGRSEEKQMVLCRFSRGRTNQTVPDMIGTRFSGTIQTDGYQTYHSYAKAVETTISIGYWAHVVIKSKDALKADEGYRKICRLPKEEQKAALEKNPGLLEFVRIRNYLTLLFAHEEKASELAPDWQKVKEYRDANIRPIMNTIFAKAEALLPKMPPKGLKGTALTYVVNQKPYLLETLEDGRYELTNLRDERLVKRFVLWRKN